MRVVRGTTRDARPNPLVAFRIAFVLRPGHLGILHSAEQGDALDKSPKL